MTDDKDNQVFYLKRTYEWLMKQLRSLGLINSTETDRENDFLNPTQVKAKADALQKEKDDKRLLYMDEEKNDKFMKEMFIYEERTEHKGVIPAKDRIRQYKTKNIMGNSIQSACPKPPTAKGARGARNLAGAQSAVDFKVMPNSTKAGGRPTTAAISHMGVSEAPTADTIANSQSVT